MLHDFGNGNIEWGQVKRLMEMDVLVFMIKLTPDMDIWITVLLLVMSTLNEMAMLRFSKSKR